MKVQILNLGRSKSEVDVAPGTTVQDALEKAGVSADGRKISVNGINGSSSHELNQGDVITLQPKVEGGVSL